MHIFSVLINILQPPPSQFDHLEVPQYEEKVSVIVDKETKDKVYELERQLKQITRIDLGIDSLGNVNFNDLCIHLGLKFLKILSVLSLKILTARVALAPT